jgi:predicted TIM-barrel fold metal-dependent hydrolase
MANPGDRLISADDHMDLNVLPPKLWLERLPVKFREQAPRVVETPDGPWWQAGGKLITPSGKKAAANKDHGLGFRPADPKSRLEDMDKDGVDASVIYGPPGGLRFPEQELNDACLGAYNDWALEFNTHAPRRLLTLALLPSHAPGVAQAELERVAKAGHRGVVLDLHESKVPAFMPAWENFWAAANEAAIPVHFHLGGGLHSLSPKPNSWLMPARVSVIPMQLDESIPGMIFSGLLERYPKVKIVLGESGLGWIPYVLERMDFEYRNYFERIQDYRIKELPSFYWQRQMFATYEEDVFGLEHIEHIGAGNVMWASDYPHGDTTWPHSRKHIMESPLGKLTEAQRRAITCDNAARVYGLN